MAARPPSRTARNTAMWRAVHSLIDDEPRILADPFARDLAGFESDEALLAANAAHPMAHAPWIRTQFPLRNRLAEERLAEAVADGVRQYVILGAGLDSFVYRRPDLMAALTVFEVDHPASQAWKRQRISDLGLAEPRGLRYVPVDFEHQTLTDGLSASGFDQTRPVVVSWLGVTQYLTHNAVQQSLRETAAMSNAACTLIVEYIAPASDLDPEGAAFVTAVASGAASVGEPWLSYFTDTDMDAALRAAGFRTVAHVGPEEATRRYLEGRNDGSRLPACFRMAVAST